MEYYEAIKKNEKALWVYVWKLEVQNIVYLLINA